MCEKNELGASIGKIKNSLTLLLYIKTTKLTHHVIRSENIGKIVNLSANDFGVLEQRFSYLVSLACYPFTFIGCIVLLVARIGWPAAVGTIIVVLMIVLVVIMSKNTG